MITITYKGKTYRWTEKKWKSCEPTDWLDLVIQNDLVCFSNWEWLLHNTYLTVEELVKLGYLEEVKENEDPVGDTIIKDMLDNAYKVTYAKEPVHKADEYLKENDYHIGGVDLKVNKDHSILEKLREELGRRIKVVEWMQWIWHWPYVNGRLFELNEVCDFLTSLEQPTEELQPELDLSESNTTSYGDAKTWQPTPWQMIEVSNDNISWTLWKYTGKILCNQFCIEWYDIWFNYARQPQEEIELLPKFNREIVEERAMNSHAHQVITLAWISDILVEQVELLTNAVNKLIKAKKK